MARPLGAGLTNSADTYGMDGGGPGVPASMISRSAIAALHAGPRAHVYHYKTFTILVWNHNLLPDLTGKPVIPSGVPRKNNCIKRLVTASYGRTGWSHTPGGPAGAIRP
jgi:hypothetical protein